MLDFSACTKVFLACGVTDLRKSFHGLSAIVKLQFKLDPYSKCMFVFCNRKRTLIKALQWDGNGFCLFMKRLDRGNFLWPESTCKVKTISIKELRWIFDGLCIEQKGAFKDRHPSIII